METERNCPFHEPLGLHTLSKIMKNRGLRMHKREMEHEVAEHMHDIKLGLIHLAGNDAKVSKKEQTTIHKMLQSIQHDLRKEKQLHYVHTKEKILERFVKNIVKKNTPIEIVPGKWKTAGGREVHVVAIWNKNHGAEWSVYDNGLSVRYAGDGRTSPIQIFKAAVELPREKHVDLYTEYRLVEKVALWGNKKNHYKDLNKNKVPDLYARYADDLNENLSSYEAWTSWKKPSDPRFPEARLKIAAPSGESKEQHTIL